MLSISKLYLKRGPSTLLLCRQGLRQGVWLAVAKCLDTAPAIAFPPPPPLPWRHPYVGHRFVTMGAGGSLCVFCVICRLLTRVSYGFRWPGRLFSGLVLSPKNRERVEIWVEWWIEGKDEDSGPSVDIGRDLRRARGRHKPHDDDWHPADEISADNQSELGRQLDFHFEILSVIRKNEIEIKMIGNNQTTRKKQGSLQVLYRVAQN